MTQKADSDSQLLVLNYLIGSSLAAVMDGTLRLQVSILTIDG